MSQKEISMEDALEYRIGEPLRQRGWTLAVSESCTGGLMGHRITNVPGSSDYYLGSVVAYAYEAKERLLGVKRATLEKYGAVSKETALEMAQGVRQVLHADIGISVTGIAGPGGGLPNKPVGLVWIGMVTPTGEWAWSYLWNGNRIENKEYSAEAALKHLFDYLKGNHPEIIHVQAHWDPKGRVNPLQFTWNGQIYNVISTGRRWKDEIGEHILCMTVEERVFELVYHPLTENWSLGFRAESTAKV